MARQYIIGENAKQAIKVLTKLRKNDFAFTVDILGEATVSEDEAAQQNILHYIEIGKQEVKLLISQEVKYEGYYVALTIFADI